MKPTQFQIPDMTEQSNEVFRDLAHTDIRIAHHSCAMKRGVGFLGISVALLNCMHESLCSKVSQPHPQDISRRQKSTLIYLLCQKMIQQRSYLGGGRQHGLLPDRLCQACPAPASDWGQRRNRGNLVQRTEKIFQAHTVTVVARAEPRARSTFMQNYSNQGGGTPKQTPKNNLQSNK